LAQGRSVTRMAQPGVSRACELSPIDTLESPPDPYSLVMSPVSSCSSSDDAMVTAIHHKKLSHALRRHEAGRRMQPISFAPASVPQFYRRCPEEEDRLVKQKSLDA